MALQAMRGAAGMVIFGLVFSGVAAGNIVYDWAGTCSDQCTGTATAVLTLAGTYVPGDAFATTDFISFSYDSNVIQYEFKAGQNDVFADGTPPVSTGHGLRHGR